METGLVAGPADSALPEVARLIVAFSSKYWKSIALSVAESIFSYLLALLFGCLLLSLIRVQVKLGISSSAAFAALGVLGTIVVALQVAVRSFPEPPGTAGGVAQAVARQRGLELFARLCAVAAVAVAGSVVIGYWPHSFRSWNVWALLGSVAGGLLIAGLAADASTATAERWSGPLTEVRKAIAISEHANALLRLDRGSEKSSLGGALVRGVAWCVGAPVLIAALAAFAAGLRSGASVLVTSLVVFVWIYLSLLLLRLGVLTRHLGWTLTGGGYFLFVVVWVPVSVVVTAGRYSGFPSWAAALVCVGYLSVPVAGALVAITRLGTHRGSAAVLITWFIELRLRQLETGDVGARRPDELFWSGVSRFAAVLLPLGVYPVAQSRLTATLGSLYGSVASRALGPATPWTADRVARLKLIERRWRTAGWLSLGAVVAHVVIVVVIVGSALAPR